MKKGFTLIELLAVIVILAIIAVIAVPIVISIINDSTSSTALRSGEFYIKAVENAIAKKNMDTGGNFNPTKCDINTQGNLNCGDETLEIEIDGERPTDGFVEYNEGKLVAAEIEFTDDSIVMNKVGKLVSLEDDIVCERADEETKGAGNVPSEGFKAGDAYICEVKEGVKYLFFVVNTEGDNVNLIMNRNIAKDGTEAINSGNNVPWVSKADYNDDTNYGSKGNTNKGPITAMNFLYNATKDWDNIPDIQMNYENNDKYGSIKTDNNITKITTKDGIITADYKNLKARLPYKTEVANYNGTNGYLYDWLIGSNSQNTITGVERYWIISNFGATSKTAVSATVYGLEANVPNIYVYVAAGVRPVISVPISDIY